MAQQSQTHAEFVAAAARVQAKTQPPKPVLKVVTADDQSTPPDANQPTDTGQPGNTAAATATATATNTNQQLAALSQTLLDAALAAENERFFVSIEGGKTSIFMEGLDPETGRPSITPLSQTEYKLLRANVMVEVPIPNSTNTKPVCVADAWVRWGGRREYPNGIALLPGQDAPKGVYNGWKGLGIEPRPGDAKPALRHIHKVICSGNEAHTKYLIRWLAFAVQHPGEQAETAVVLRGGRGTGKGFLGRWMCEIFGAHGMHILNSRHLVGNFNAHLRLTCFMFCDEAFFAGDRAGGDVLKGLITEPTLTIERKGIDAFTARNRLKLLMASNSDWVIPAGTDERRYFVLDVSDSQKQNHEYFAKLDAHMKNGGLAALLDYLLKLDISKFNIRAVPRTEALDQQKLLSLAPLHAWLYARLYAGSLVADGFEWETEVSRNTVVASFAEHTGRKGARYENTDAAFVGRALRKIYPDLGETKRTEGNRRVRHWVFPDLDEARRQFEQVVMAGSAIDWPENS